MLTNGGHFGASVASIGDLDGDEIADLAVGASRDNTGGIGGGAVYVLFMNANGTVKTSTKIAHNTNGGPTLAQLDGFGGALTALGDINGDGIEDVAVGARGDDTGGNGRGAVHVLFLNADGTVKNSQKIANNTGGGPVLKNDDRFGISLAAVGDLVEGDRAKRLRIPWKHTPLVRVRHRHSRVDGARIDCEPPRRP